MKCSVIFTCHIWFGVEKNEKKIIAAFHVLWLFMAIKHDLSEKKVHMSRAVAVERKICATPTA
jgi:hypothetical protein